MSFRGAREIQAATCKLYHLDPEELLGKARYAELVDARHLCIYLCRTRLRMSLHALGKVFLRDHSTVAYACKHVAERLGEDDRLRGQLAALEHLIEKKTRRETV